MAALTERAMLVRLRVSTWTGSRKNKRVTEENCARYGATRDAGVWLDHFIPDVWRKKLISAAGKLRNEAKHQTLPWLDDSTRILRSDTFMDYRKRLQAELAKYNEVWEEFLKEYPAILANMPNRLQGLANQGQMPSVTELRSKFGATMDVFPISNHQDFRSEMDDEDMKEVKAQMESTYQHNMKRMMNDVWGQMIAMVGKIEAKLSDPDKKFHDSLITNLIELCIQLPKMNLTEDGDLKVMRKEVIDKLCHLKPDNLRHDKTERKDAAKKAKELMEKMKGYTS